MPFWLGEAYRSLGEYNEAVSCYEQAARCFGEHEALFFQMAECHRQAGRTAAARELYEKALVRNPGFKEAEDRLAQLAAGG